MLLDMEKFNTHSEFNSSLIVKRETYELFSRKSMSAYHLNGIFDNSGENSNGTVHPGGKFSVKR